MDALKILLLFYHILAHLPGVTMASARDNTKEKIMLGYLTGSRKKPNNYFYERPGQSISGGMTLAVQEVNDNPHILPDHELDFLIAETYGEEPESIKQTVMLMQQNISAYIGPQETCVHEARIAASFNLPMISYFCTNHDVSDKTLYPTFARTKPHDSQISMAIVSLLLKYQWRKVAFVYNEMKPMLAETILEVLDNYRIQVTAKKSFTGPFFPETMVNASPFIKIVSDTYEKARVYVMLADFYEFEGLLIALRLKGLLDTGEYIVVGVDPKQYDSSDPQKYIEGYFTKSSQGTVSPEVVEAFRGFLFVTPAAPVYPWFDNFTEIVNYYLEAPPFNFTNPFTPHGILKILRAEAAYLYDAVWIYARATHMAITRGHAPSDGQAILKYIKGTTYKSAMGYMNHIDENGDSQGNFTLLVRKYDEKGYGMFPVGTFLLNQNDTRLPEMQLLEGETIDWIGGGPPVDEPECGFLGEKCVPGPTYTIHVVVGVLGGILFCISIIGVLIYRNWKYEQELASLLWKIDYRDIDIKAHTSQYGGGMGLNRMNTALRSSMVSLSSQADLDLRQVFTQVATYKGSIIAIKHVNTKSIDLTRAVRKELKQIRDLRHDNLNTFIGACVDPGNICIITEYCTKGSLQDILANDDVKLDNMFIASLIFDIIKGMIFLHNSVIQSHGSLKSSNCVVDSRWVLKITDYGLYQLKDGADQVVDKTTHAYHQSRLWTAPEFLRDQTLPSGGTQKGDVYSFGIILYEIHGRCGPYGDTELDPEDIIRQVIQPECHPPFRPKLSAVGSVPAVVTDCMRECWHEDPNVRPDFKTLRRMLKPMQKGMKPNIFDNMMAIMEKYATNLETIVEERTDMLREEKKRTEELLHQMLPRLVADQLKEGKRVEAEAFDSVTIYFSDICGFTSMSSESTPMQVVDLLNDLYTTFDSTSENYDVYKVETIGDAYMVVSGLPKRNGIQHAGEIASMSLRLLSAIKQFKIRHRPNDTLELRIGIHTGPCVAGVVGLKMPRYCLFGDTVNTSSRMESNGLPLKIHCSGETKGLLDKLGGYHLAERGIISMKGKGDLLTYWLEGEDCSRRTARIKPPCVASTGRSPKVYRPSARRSPNTLQKNSSLPILKPPDSVEKDLDKSPPDNLLNPNGCFMYKQDETDGGSFPGSTRSTLSPHRTDNDWYSRRGRRSASVKIKFNDETIPEHGVYNEQKRRDSLWDSFPRTGEANALTTEGSPLLCRQGVDEIRLPNGLGRKPTDDTCV